MKINIAKRRVFMTLRYILLICTSLGVFTVFALASEVAVENSHSLNLYTQDGQNEKERSVEKQYFDERNTGAKALAVTGDDFDSMTAEMIHSPTIEQARKPTDPAVAAAHDALLRELKSLKMLQNATDTSKEIYPEQNSMKEAVIEQQEEEGVDVRPNLSPSQVKAAVMGFIPPS